MRNDRSSSISSNRSSITTIKIKIRTTLLSLLPQISEGFASRKTLRILRSLRLRIQSTEKNKNMNRLNRKSMR